VFVPIAFMEGVIGKFFYAFGITVATAVMISLFVSFTLDPMLSAYWPDKDHNAAFKMPVLGRMLKKFDGLMSGMERRYGRLIAWSLGHKKTVVFIALASLVGALALVPRLGSEFMPEVDQGFTNVNVQLPPGGTLAYADGKARRAEELIKDVPEIDMVKTDVSAQSVGLAIKLKPRDQRKRKQKEIEEDIRQRLSVVPGLELQIGWNRPIYVALLGNNDAELERVMLQLRDKVQKIKGITDLETSMKPGTPALSVRLKPEAANLGLTNASVASTLRAMVSGESAGIWSAPDGENYSLIVRLPQNQRTNFDDLRQMNVATGRMRPDGSPMVVPLEQVAVIERINSPEVIKRQDLQRRVALYAGVKDRSAGEVSEEVKQAVKEIEATLPLGLRFDVGGQQQELDQSFKAALAALGLAVILLYFILGSQFGSFLQPFAIMVSLPLSLIGVVLALLVTKTTMNIFSMIGIIMLMGLVTKNAILLVDFANRAQRIDGMSQYDALIKAGEVRLRPILMTTAAMVLGMLPLALGLGEGSEQQSPMGRAIIGGVISSTFLTLIVVPVFYTWADRKGAKAAKLAKKAAQQAKDLPAVAVPQGAE
jgi:hydrophobic/amphiphilic exporter-1 (mainly G- bacteria), HAE1 family